MKNTFEEEDDLKELLELELVREANQLEDALLSDEDTDELQISDEDTDAAFADLMLRLQNESDDQAGRNVVPFPKKRKNSSRPIRHFSLGKAAGFALVVLLSVFAGSMTSKANRQYLRKRIQYLSGANARVVAENDEETYQSIRDEDEAIRKIETLFNVEIPEFFYRPEDMKFFSLFIDEQGGIAQLEYYFSGNHTLGVFTLFCQSESRASLATNIHGDFTVELSDQNIGIYIQETANENSEPEYNASWIYQDTLYEFKARLEKLEFEKLVKSIQF